MVQMKERGCCFNSHFSVLYIPHGSDEREELNFEDPADFVLYIPHGSDESGYSTNIGNNVFELYIPHGSDESN